MHQPSVSMAPPGRHVLVFVLVCLGTVCVSAASSDRRPHKPPKVLPATDSSSPEGASPLSVEEDNPDDGSENYHYEDDADESALLAESDPSLNYEEDSLAEPGATDYDNQLRVAPTPANFANDAPKEAVLEEEVQIDEDDFCQDNYVDSAYFNGYDTILTRGDRLWYYYKDQHRLSKAYDQRRFTQGDHIQGAFNVSRTPRCARVPFSRSPNTSNSPSHLSVDQATSESDTTSPSSTSSPSITDCSEIGKMQGMAVYFLHNKDRSRSYYNLDVRNANGTQKRVRSRDLPWGMKQVGLLGGNLWPNGWEAYQQYRPVAFLPSRYELIFIINHFHSHEHVAVLDNSSLVAGSDFPSGHRSTALLTWNTLDTTSWNSSWRSRVLTHKHPVVYTGMFEMNGIVYAIGESRQPSPDGKLQRLGKMYRYFVTDQDGRDLRETDQSVRDFFGCPRRKEKPAVEVPVLPVSTTSSTTSTSIPTSTSTSTSTTTSTTTTTTSTSTTKSPQLNLEHVSLEDRDDSRLPNQLSPLSPPASGPNSGGNRLKSANVFLSSPSDQSNQIYSSVFLRNSKAKIQPVASNGSTHLLTPPTAPGVTLRESDSILLTIFIGIVISACIATIILAFLTITGRKKAPPRFEGARIERTIPKPTIIGLDYHPRKNSSASSTHLNLMPRYDSMNSINAIYSQIGKPNANGGVGNQQKKKKTKVKSMNPYHTVDRLNGYGPSGASLAPHAKSNSSSSQNHHPDISGHANGGTTFQHFDAFD